MKKLLLLLKRQPSERLIVLGFIIVILFGTALLLLPFSTKPEVEISFLDSLFTSTSAVCITGLTVVDTGDSFTVFGRIVVAILIQTGGLGITSIGAGFILAAGGKISLKGRRLVKEALNVNSSKGIICLVKDVLLMSVCFELVGSALSFIVFIQDFPPLKALEISFFHSIASYCNAGFDILGGMQNLIRYQSDLFLNLITCVLIIAGGLGFLVIIDIRRNHSFRKLCFHSKVVITTTSVLLLLGLLSLKATENISWLGAFFQSVSARTAGFCTYPVGEFSTAGLFTLLILMFIGASPGSTGGGIKTSTFFVLAQSVRSLITMRKPEAFHRSIAKESISKAFMITFLSFLVILTGTFLLCMIHPELSFMEILFEVTSAFGTVGLSTGITPALAGAGKIVIILIMFTGRLGALTLISILARRQLPNARYAEETITI